MIRFACFAVNVVVIAIGIHIHSVRTTAIGAVALFFTFLAILSKAKK